MRPASKILVERRSYRRFYIEGMVMNSDGSVCAHILNIGLGGLALRYAVAEEAWSSGREELVSLSGKGFFLAGVPLITVSESIQHNGIYAIKRHGARFGKLTPAQSAYIERIITEEL